MSYNYHENGRSTTIYRDLGAVDEYKCDNYCSCKDSDERSTKDIQDYNYYVLGKKPLLNTEQNYGCIPDPNVKGAQICAPLQEGGGYTDATCNGDCVCLPGYKNVNGQCYKTVYAGPFGNPSSFGGCNFIHGCSAENNECNNRSPGWKSHCHGSCLETCNCDCYIPKNSIPVGYNWCDYKTKKWITCDNPKGCSDSGKWGALKTNSQKGKYCPLPTNK